jgi:hypothetical protein
LTLRRLPSLLYEKKPNFLIPEAEETLTKSESVLLRPNQTAVEINQKFSFEKTQTNPKVFLTFWKRQEK